MNPSAWTVCVIEPNKFERQIIVDLLRNAGVDKIKAVGDGEDGVEMLEVYNANIVIASFELPKGDGAGWTRAFRRNRKLANRKAAIFITSGAFSLSMAEQCRHAGANALIGKPLSAKVLIATINKVLANPRPFIDAEGYVGPCRRAGTVTAGAPKKRRQADAERAQAPSGDALTLAQVVGALANATAEFAQDAAKAEACESALRQVQAYAVNAGDGPLLRACAAFTLQIKASRAVRNEPARAALQACAQGVAELASLDPAQAERRDAAAERVREAVAKAALQRAA
jgi:CheY-like chemotaxis protein